MKKTIAIAGIALMAAAAPFELRAQEAQLKVIAIGDVETGSALGGGGTSGMKETIQLGLKKEIEKQGKGRLVVQIVSPEAMAEGTQAEAATIPAMPTNRAPTQKEMTQYLAAMQQWQQRMTGQGKTHRPVAADAYFDLRLASGTSGVDTSGAASTIGSLTGLDTSFGSVSTKTTKVYLIATMRDPKTGAPLDQYTAKASSVHIRNIAGYSEDDYGSDELTREDLFSSAIKDCAKWIASKVP